MSKHENRILVIEIFLTILYQFFVEVKQLERHQKSEKWVLGDKIWVYALKMAKIWDFWTFGPMSKPENRILVIENNFN